MVAALAAIQQTPRRQKRTSRGQSRHSGKPMKNQTDSPPLYLWSQAKDAADKLATWAYTTLIKPESPHAKTYPLQGASSTLLQDGSWGLVLPQPEEPTQTKETPESIRFSQQPKEFLEPSRVRQQLEEIANALQKTSDFSKIQALQAKIEAEQKAKAQAERVEAARREAEEKAKAQAERVALRKQEEENAKAVAKVRRSVKRICPHCGCEGTYEVTVEPSVKSHVVRCQGSGRGCGKNFTVQNLSDDMITPLADILYELQRVKFLLGFLFFWLVVLPLICWAIIANIHK